MTSNMKLKGTVTKHEIVDVEINSYEVMKQIRDSVYRTQKMPIDSWKNKSGIWMQDDSYHGSHFVQDEKICEKQPTEKQEELLLAMDRALDVVRETL